MRLTKEDAIGRARALLSYGITASLAIAQDDICGLGQAIAGMEEKLHELKRYHAPRAGWVLSAHEDDELGSEG